MSKSNKVHPLNAKAIKDAFKCYEIKTISCKQRSTGSLKGSINLVVKTTDAVEVASICANLGIVNIFGKLLKVLPTSKPYYDFGSLYMSDEMHKELNN
jgi:hypothetical protein